MAVLGIEIEEFLPDIATREEFKLRRHKDFVTNCSRYSNFPINFIGLWVATDLLRWGRRGAIAGNGAKPMNIAAFAGMTPAVRG